MISLPDFLKSQQGIPEILKDIKKKFIIDCDAGSDDAHAILTAIHCAKLIDAEIIGITCVSGNTQLVQVIKNVKIALVLAGAPNIPIYSGCDKSIAQTQWTDCFFLEDGLSGHQSSYIQDLNLNLENLTQKKHAVQFIIDSIHKYKEDLSIIVIGPMTNIACAIIKDHNLEKLIGQIVFLGGNICGLGIVENGVAEFNSFTDVEAIHLVFKVLQEKIIMIPYESIFTATSDHVQNTFQYKQTHKGQFVNRIYESMYKFLNRYDIQDPLSILVAMMPDVITNYTERKCQIILHGQARGLVAVDWIDVMKTQYKLQGYVTIITGLDKIKIQSILHEVIKDDDPQIIQLLQKLI